MCQCIECVGDKYESPEEEEIARLRELISGMDNAKLYESVVLLRADLQRSQELLSIECETSAKCRNERDAALAKIAAHNAKMGESCHAACKFNVCEEDHRNSVKCGTCPRHYRIEVDE